MTRPERALEEAARVLRRGGRFMCMEFSHVQTAPLRSLYDAYSFAVIPALGRLVVSPPGRPPKHRNVQSTIAL